MQSRGISRRSVSRRYGSPPSLVSITTIAVVLTFLPMVIFAQSPGRIRVNVLPIENRTGRTQFDAVGATVADTAVLTLRLLGTYQISQGRQSLTS